MKALVTGCAGFIGSHVTEKLLASGHEVTGIDAFLDYYPVRMKENNLAAAMKSARFRLIRGNILGMDRFPEADYVFHLAAQAGLRSSWGAGFRAHVANNVETTQRLLEHYKDAHIRKFVYASSSSVYGNGDMPMKETSPTRPLSPYGVTKLAAESLCGLYRENYGIPVITLRYFTVYGPRQRPDMAIHKFFRAVLAGERLTVFGDGEQTRDFTYVSDVVDATVLAADGGGAGGTFNIGGGSRTSVNDLIAEIERVSGRTALVDYVDRQKGDADDTLADISKAAAVLGWAPRVPLKAGLRKFFEYFPTAGQE